MLTYYATRIPGKQHWFETIEGYRIYKDVPVCRTGYQEYLGSELKQHQDYDPAWNLQDDEVVQVYRPKEVVTAPETVASFEGKSVLDGHPPDYVAIVTADNDTEYAKGHGQNLRVGPPLEDGEIPILADLFVKSRELNDKIDAGLRDISCGYLYRLKRAEDGTFVMTKIEGNHFAVVPNGRAGPDISIRDAAPSIRQSPEKNKARKENHMVDKKSSIWGRMLKAFAADAEPEEVAEAAKLAHEHEVRSHDTEPEEEERRHEKAAEDRRHHRRLARDEEHESEHEEEHGEHEERHEYELHPRMAEACDHIAHMRKALDAIHEHLGVGKKESAEDESEANAMEMTEQEEGESVLPAQIARDTSFRALKRAVGRAGDKYLADAFTAFERRLKGKPAAPDRNPYADLITVIPAAHDAAPEVDPTVFFNGVTYAEGLRRYEEYKAKKGDR
jgi:hypothetical protein